MIEIIYDQEVLNNANEIYHLNKNIIMSIDIGVENLITITDNIGSQPIIIKSEIWKAENQWYNKKRAEFSAIYDIQITGCKLPKIDSNTGKRKFKTGFIGKYIIGEYNQKIGCKLPKQIGNIIDYITHKNGKKIKILTENRNHFVMDSQHKVSRFIIERALDIKAGTVVFGKNPLWKQNAEMGRRNNQNFVQIPHAEIIDKTRYKGEEVGISVLDETEEYTSKCSFLGSESIEYHMKYMGKRIYRGLFKCSKGVDISAHTGNKKERIFDTVNADVQGSYNILRKVNPRFSVLDIMEGVVVHGLVPLRLSISDLMINNYQQLSMKHRLKIGVGTLVENIDSINN
jgi:putative transposase